jgi:hypothetical protein
MTRARTSKIIQDNIVRFRQENNPMNSISHFSTNKFIRVYRAPCWGLRHRALPFAQYHGLKTVRSLQKHLKTLSFCIHSSLILEDATWIDLNQRPREQIRIDFSPSMEDPTRIDLKQQPREQIRIDFSPSMEDATWINLNLRSRGRIWSDFSPCLENVTSMYLNHRIKCRFTTIGCRHQNHVLLFVVCHTDRHLWKTSLHLLRMILVSSCLCMQVDSESKSALRYPMISHLCLGIAVIWHLQMTGDC